MTSTHPPDETALAISLRYIANGKVIGACQRDGRSRTFVIELIQDGRLTNAIVAGMLSEILQTAQIVIENVAISRRQPVVVQYCFQRPDDIVHFSPVVASASQKVLKLIQLLLGPHNPALIAAKWESDSLDVVKILPDSSEQA